MIGALGGASGGGARMGAGVSVAGPSSWEFSNLPSGWVTVAEHDASAVTPTGWSVASRDSTTAHEIVSTTTPIGTAALRQHWDGVTDGQSPDFVYTGLSSQTKVYYATIMRLSSTWEWGTGYGCKWGTLMPAAAGGGWTNVNPYFPTGGNRFTSSWFWTDQAGHASYNWMTEPDPTVSGQYQSGSAAWQHITPTPIVNGTWFKKEALVEYDVGRVRMWLDGVLVADSLTQSGVEWPFPVGYSVTEFQNGSTLGGASGMGPLSSDYYADYASILIARPPS